MKKEHLSTVEKGREAGLWSQHAQYDATKIMQCCIIFPPYILIMLNGQILFPKWSWVPMGELNMIPRSLANVTPQPGDFPIHNVTLITG